MSFTPGVFMDKLLRILYLERAYSEGGYTRDEYNTRPALVKTAQQFCRATEDMVDSAADCLPVAAAS